MAYSKVNKTTGKKPLKWWLHKYLCEFWYWYYGTSNKRYYYHLDKLCALGWNLYGEVYPPTKQLFEAYKKYRKKITMDDVNKMIEKGLNGR